MEFRVCDNNQETCITATVLGKVAVYEHLGTDEDLWISITTNDPHWARIYTISKHKPRVKRRRGRRWMTNKGGAGEEPWRLTRSYKNPDAGGSPKTSHRKTHTIAHPDKVEFPKDKVELYFKELPGAVKNGNSTRRPKDTRSNTAIDQLLEQAIKERDNFYHKADVYRVKAEEIHKQVEKLQKIQQLMSEVGVLG